jgi:fatty acid synthase
VVTEKVPWAGNLAGVSSLGLGGSNAHVILQRNQKKKVNGGAPAYSVPHLVVASGRTEEAVDVILKNVSMPAVTASCFVSKILKLAN